MKSSDDWGSGVMQDNSTSAMTEVALGLSMAFFSLLIVALVSSSVSYENQSSEQILSESAKVKIDLVTNSDSDAGAASEEVFLFYANGQFYNAQLKSIKLNEYASTENVVLALLPKVSVEEAISAKQRISQHNGLASIRITAMNEEWQSAIARLQ